MSITAEQLRKARHLERLTQAELAEKLGVSTRTVVNWERDGSSVPARSEMQVANVLGLMPLLDGGWEVIGDRPGGRPLVRVQEDANEEQHDPRRVERISQQIFDGSARAQRYASLDKESYSRLMASILIGSRDSLSLLRSAATAGAHPVTLLNLFESIVAIGIETGMSSIPGMPAKFFVHDLLAEGSEIVKDAIDQFQSDSHEPFTYGEDSPLRRKAEGLLRKNTESVSGLGDNDVAAKGSTEGSEDSGQKEDSQAGYGLAAKKRSKNRGEVDYD